MARHVEHWYPIIRTKRKRVKVVYESRLLALISRMTRKRILGMCFPTGTLLFKYQIHQMKANVLAHELIHEDQRAECAWPRWFWFLVSYALHHKSMEAEADRMEQPVADGLFPAYIFIPPEVLSRCAT